MVEMPQLNEEEMQSIYNWVDEIPLSRPKRNIARDFSDGVLMAEVVKHFMPHLVELHNYSAAHSVSQKTYNWNTLNQKVFKKLGYSITKKDIEDAVNCVPDTAERILKLFQNQVSNDINAYQEKKKMKPSSGGNNGIYSGQQLDMGNQQQYYNKENNMFYNGPNVVLQQQQHPMTAGINEMRQKHLSAQNQVNSELVVEKEQTIIQLKETIEILELKIKKLEQLVKLKDAKIQNMTNKMQSHGIL